MPDDALTTAIRGVLASSPFHGEGHRKVWARLRQGGTRTSLRRVLRLMRQLCRAIHPNPQGEPALGTHLRHRRRASAGAAGLSGGLQHHLAHRTARVSDTCRHAAEPAFTRGTGRVRLNPVSHKPGAVHGLASQRGRLAASSTRRRATYKRALLPLRAAGGVRAGDDRRYGPG